VIEVVLHAYLEFAAIVTALALGFAVYGMARIVVR
jgi:hypothetical protein